MVESVRSTEANLTQENILSTRPIRGIAQSSISTTPTRLESTSHLLSRILKNLREVCISELAVQAGFSLKKSSPGNSISIRPTLTRQIPIEWVVFLSTCW